MRTPFFAFLLTVFTVAPPAVAQWTELGTPGDAAIYSLCSEGDTIYAGTQYDLIRSVDNGLSWSLNDAGLTTTMVPAASLTVSAGIVFAGSGSAGVYRSTDHGESWQEANNGLPALARTNTQIHAHNGILYIGIGGFGSQGFYRSTNNGDLWEPFSGGPDTTVTAIAGWGDTLMAATIDGRVFVSPDLGQNWSAGSFLSGSFPPVRQIIVAGPDLFAASGGYGIFRSDDRGASWTAVNNGFTDPSAWTRPLVVIDTVLFTGIDYSGNGGVWRSSNRGDSWENVSGTRMTIGTAPAVGLVDVFFKQYVMLANGATLFAGTFGYGLFRSTDLGETWSQATVPFRHEYLPALALIGDSLFTGGPAVEAAYVSGDGGLHWEGYRTNLLAGVTSFARDSQYLYAALAPTIFSHGVGRSSDGGATWTEASAGLPSATNNRIVADGNTLYAATDGGLFTSSDRGGSWAATTWTDDAVGLYARDSLLIVGTLFPQRTYRSVDRGATWDSVAGGLPLNFAARSFAAIGQKLFICGTGSSSSLFVSGDDGATWTNATGSTLAVQVLADGNILWVNGISPWFSVDTGRTWTQVPLAINVPNSFTSIAVGGGFIYGAVGGGGVKGLFRRALSGLVDVEESATGVPRESRLEQNYPNPFNPSTIVRFAIAEPGHATLEVFNVLGAKMASLFSDFATPGMHEVEWNAAAMPGGLYFVRLQTGSVREIRKAILMK